MAVSALQWHIWSTYIIQLIFLLAKLCAVVLWLKLNCLMDDLTVTKWSIGWLKYWLPDCLLLAVWGVRACVHACVCVCVCVCVCSIAAYCSQTCTIRKLCMHKIELLYVYSRYMVLEGNPLYLTLSMRVVCTQWRIRRWTWGRWHSPIILMSWVHPLLMDYSYQVTDDSWETIDIIYACVTLLIHIRCANECSIYWAIHSVHQ